MSDGLWRGFCESLRDLWVREWKGGGVAREGGGVNISGQVVKETTRCGYKAQLSITE